jgi:hypothetical protein
MAFASWLSSLFRTRRRSVRGLTGRPTRLCLEGLENRLVPSVTTFPTFVSFGAASETINAAAGAFKIPVALLDVIPVGVATDTVVTFTLGGSATAGTDYNDVSPSPLVFREIPGVEYITGTLLPHPGGPDQTLTFTLGTVSPVNPDIRLGRPDVNTLTIIEPPLSNQPSTVASDRAAVSADEGGTVTNTGTFQNPAGTTLTASIGTVTQNNALGTWSWSLNLADGPLVPTPVTITATDNQGASASTTFFYAANLVPPTIALSGSATVNEGAPYTLNLGAITDPGQDPISGYTIDWGDGTSDTFTGNPANTTATHTFDDGPAAQTPSVMVTDDDGSVLAGSLGVNVLNVAPTAALATNSGITYGTAATASFSGPFDPSSADIAAGFHYAFSLDTDTTGSATYANSGTSSSANFGTLGAGPHTVYARIIDKNDGFTPYQSALTVAPAGSTVTVRATDPAPIVYDGDPHSATAGWISTGSDGTGAALPVTYVGINGTVYASSTTAPTNAGDYEASASYPGDNNHTGSSSVADFTIGKASSTTTTVGAGPFTYTGSAQVGGSGTVTGAGGLSTSATTLSYSANSDGTGTADQIDAGTYFVMAHYAGDANHSASDGAPVAITIGKASSVTTTVGAGPFTYDGSVHSGGSGTITGSATLSYSGDQVDAGTYFVTAHYAGDANHLPSDGTAVGITINPATLPVIVTSDLMLANQNGRTPPPLTGTVNGVAFTGSTTFTTAQGDALTITLSSAVTATSPVGVYPIVATVTGAATANYVQPTGGNLYVVTVGHEAGTGAKNVSFWDNKGNARLITATDLMALNQLDLVNNNVGSDFDPTTAAQLQRWFRSDTDSITKALSIQLAVMDLNVLSGNVNTANVVYAGYLLKFVGSGHDVTGLDGGGFITVGNLMTLANNALAQYPSAGKRDDDDGGLGKYLDALEDALEAANSNGSFVQQAVPLGN